MTTAVSVFRDSFLWKRGEPAGFLPVTGPQRFHNMRVRQMYMPVQIAWRQGDTTTPRPGSGRGVLCSETAASGLGE